MQILQQLNKKIAMGFHHYIAILCATGLCASALAQSAPVPGPRLPALGDAISEGFDVGTERRLGEHIMREIWRDPDYMDDAALLDYVQTVWQPLVAQAKQRGDIGADIENRFAWQPFLVRERSVNAFALPGGYMGIHLGLLAMTGSRDELASVLGHELTHITQRHIGRSIANAKKQSLLSVAAMVVGVLAASRSARSDGPSAVIAGGQALAAQGQLNFSRDMEREADRIGLSVMVDAGFAPSGMAAMFEKLEHSARLNDSGGFAYLRSHPLNSERIGEARLRAGSASQLGENPTAALLHTLARARARVLMDTRAVALRRWQDNSVARNASVEEQLLANYSSALASTLLRDWAIAQTSLQRLQSIALRGSPTDLQIRKDIALLGAQLALAQSNSQQALALLAPHRQENAPRAVLFLAAQAALLAPLEQQKSAQELQAWVSNSPLDAPAWLLLGQLWRALDHPLRALRAEAESKAAVGDLLGALDRLREGQRIAKTQGVQADTVEAAVITSRLRALDALWRQQVQEKIEH
jgi:beta-barrel assembly-enhancing protease